MDEGLHHFDCLDLVTLKKAVRERVLVFRGLIPKSSWARWVWGLRDPSAWVSYLELTQPWVSLHAYQ